MRESLQRVFFGVCRGCKGAEWCIFWACRACKGSEWCIFGVCRACKGSEWCIFGVCTSCKWRKRGLFHRFTMWKPPARTLFDRFMGCKLPVRVLFHSLHGLQTTCKGPFPLFARAANSLRGSFFTLCTGCKLLARGLFSREAEVATRKVGESQTFCSFYLFKKGWKSWCFSLECGCFICVAYEDVNVATGDVCDV